MFPLARDCVFPTESRNRGCGSLATSACHCYPFSLTSGLGGGLWDSCGLPPSQKLLVLTCDYMGDNSPTAHFSSPLSPQLYSPTSPSLREFYLQSNISFSPSLSVMSQLLITRTLLSLSLPPPVSTVASPIVLLLFSVLTFHPRVKQLLTLTRSHHHTVTYS